VKSAKEQEPESRDSHGSDARDREGEPLRYVHPAAIPGTEFIFARNCLRKWRVFHESYVVCLCVRTSATYRYRGRLGSLAQSPGCMLMEPGETHVNVVVPQPQTYTVLRISPEVVARAGVELGITDQPHFAMAFDTNPAIVAAFARLATAVDAGDTDLEQQSWFAHGLRLVLQYCIEQGRSPPTHNSRAAHGAVERAKTYLRQRYRETVTLDELARVAGLSRFHLLRSFTARTGMPPHAYQVRLRIERACRLLQAGAEASSVATILGFADQSHLTRHFRRVMDITPARYIRARA
jgi:AraC-like DNA-binding protein